MSNKRPDFTLIAVKRQLKAMNVSNYEVGLFHRANNQMLPRFLTAQTILKSIDWFKTMNYQGHDIFIRPAGSQGLVFFDDLNIGTIEKMKTDGYAPAVLVESSPMNFHGWLKVSETPISEDVATIVSKLIAHRYGGDTNSADWRHYGRLAGFTNQKLEHIKADGKQPFVLLSSGAGKLAENAEKILSKAHGLTESNKVKKLDRKAVIANIKNKTNLRDPCSFYESELLGLEKRYPILNTSKADWMIVNKMIDKGYGEAHIRQAMEACSPALEKRARYADDYINLTLDKAYAR